MLLRGGEREGEREEGVCVIKVWRGMSVKVTVKCNNGTKFDVDVEVSKTVKEFKEMIAGQAGVSTGQMRLIHRGHVLKDGSTLESYGERPAAGWHSEA